MNEKSVFNVSQVVTVGYIEGGHAQNVIPQSAKFGGTFRSLSNDGLLFIKRRIKEVKRYVFYTIFLYNLVLLFE